MHRCGAHLSDHFAVLPVRRWNWRRGLGLRQRRPLPRRVHDQLSVRELLLHAAARPNRRRLRESQLLWGRRAGRGLQQQLGVLVGPVRQRRFRDGLVLANLYGSGGLSERTVDGLRAEQERLRDLLGHLLGQRRLLEIRLAAVLRPERVVRGLRDLNVARSGEARQRPTIRERTPSGWRPDEPRHRSTISRISSRDLAAMGRLPAWPGTCVSTMRGASANPVPSGPEPDPPPACGSRLRRIRPARPGHRARR